MYSLFVERLLDAVAREDMVSTILEVEIQLCMVVVDPRQ